MNVFQECRFKSVEFRASKIVVLALLFFRYKFNKDLV